MLREVLLFNLILSPLVISRRRQHNKKESSEELGGELITALKNDANLDLSMDEEYEDLRAELLAYHTALSSLTGRADDGSLPPEVAEAVAAEPGNNIPSETRRSMKTTPCWKLGGICINHKLCTGHRSLSEVPGCRDKLEVCCFTWNKYQMRDFADKGISNLALPWSNGQEFGGKGPIMADEEKEPEELNMLKGFVHENSDVLVQDISSIETHTEKSKETDIPTFESNAIRNKNGRKHKHALVVVLNPDKK